MSSRNCSEIDDKYSCDSTGTEYAEVDIPSGASHRLRFINTGAFAEFEISLDDHPLEVIEADGTPLESGSYHRLNINVAQRYSVIVNASAENSTAFWLRARMMKHCFSDPEEIAEPEVKGIVRYSAPKKKHGHRHHPTDELSLPTTKPWPDEIALICKDVDGQLRPANAPPPPSKADTLIYLRSNFEIGNYSLSRGYFNQSTWKPDLRSPLLNRVVKLDLGNTTENGTADVSPAEPQNIFDAEKGMVLQVDGIKVIDLLIDNFDDG